MKNRWKGFLAIMVVVALMIPMQVFGARFEELTVTKLKVKAIEKLNSAGLTITDPTITGLISGDEWYVDSSVSASGAATGWGNAVATIDEAINLASANNGDVIHVAAGHSESFTAADGFDVDVAGITIIGYGSGTDMPMIDFLHANAEIAIGAACVTIHNINFHSNITGVLIGVSVEIGGDYATISNCRFDVETTTTDEFNTSIDIIAGANNVTVKNNFIDMGLGGAIQAVLLKGTSAGAKIVDNTIIGDYSTACVAGSVAASTVVDIGNNLLVNGDGANLATEPCVELNGNSTGLIYDNYIVCNLATVAASIVAAKCLLFENYYNEDISGAGTGGLIGTASAND